jgi:hypothetical protein
VRCDTCHAQHPGRFQLQEARLLPQLRRPRHGRERRAAGRSTRCFPNSRFASGC